MREVEASGSTAGINSDFGQRTRKHGGRVEVSKGGRRRRIGQVVGGHVNRLHRGDRTLLGRRDALLQFAHFRRQVRLVTDGAGHAAQQRRDFRARLREAEDVVDEEQRVGAFFVAEVFGDGESGQRHAQTRAGRLGHLAVDQRGFGFGRLARLDHAGLAHFQPQIVAFAGALADAGEHGVSAVLLGDVVDQFHDDDGLADARAAEQSDLAALQERLDQVDDLHAGLEHLGGRGLLVECRGQPVNGHSVFVLDRTQFVDRFADHVHDAAQRAAAHGHGNRSALVDGLHAAHHAVGGLHGDAAHAAFAQVLLHFENDVDRRGHVEAVADDAQRLVNRRQCPFGKLHVHRGTGNLNYLSNVFCHKTSAVA